MNSIIAVLTKSLKSFSLIPQTHLEKVCPTILIDVFVIFLCHIEKNRGPNQYFELLFPAYGFLLPVGCNTKCTKLF